MQEAQREDIDDRISLSLADRILPSIANCYGASEPICSRVVCRNLTVSTVDLLKGNDNVVVCTEKNPIFLFFYYTHSVISLLCYLSGLSSLMLFDYKPQQTRCIALILVFSHSTSSVKSVFERSGKTAELTTHKRRASAINALITFSSAR